MLDEFYLVWYKKLGQLQSWAQSPKPPSLLTPTASSRGCKNHPQFPCFARSDSQNSLKAIIHAGTASYRKRIQIKISQRKKHTGQSREVQNTELLLFSPRAVKMHYSDCSDMWQCV